MTAVHSAAATAPVTGMVGAPGRAVTMLAIRQIRRGAVVVGVLAGGMTALVAATYRSTVGNGQDAAALSALAGNPAIRTLFGEPDTNFSSPTFGQVFSQANSPRSIQIALRYDF